MSLLRNRRDVDRRTRSSVDEWHRNIHGLGRAVSGFDMAEAIANEASVRRRGSTVRRRTAA